MALAHSVASTNATLQKAMSKRVVAMYRKFCRDVPRICIMYNLEQTVGEVRHMVLLHFRKSSHVHDPRIIDLLLTKANMEHQEVIELWKQRSHLMELLQPELSAPDAWQDEEEFFRR